METICSRTSDSQEFIDSRILQQYVMNPREFCDVDPRNLHLPASRVSGADPTKLQRQIARYGASMNGMPVLEVYRGTDGALLIYDGVTRATRIANCCQAGSFG